MLLALGSAVHAREILRFDYGSDSTDGPARHAEPHHLVTWDGRWYLVAWDLDRADWRTFRVDRITLRPPHGPRFTPRPLPGGDVATYLTGVFRGSGGGSADWPCRGTVVLDLPAATVARYTRDGLVEEIAPDRCRLTLGSWSWVSLAAAVARYDAEITVVGPPPLTDAFALLADRFTRTATGGVAAVARAGSAAPALSGQQRERREGVVLPQQPGGLLRVGGDRRRRVEQLGEPRSASYAGQPGSPSAANAVHAPRIRADSSFAAGGGRIADQHGGLAAAQVAEDERHVQAVAGAEAAAHARGGPGQLVEVGPAAAGELRLGEVQVGIRNSQSPLTSSYSSSSVGGRERLAVAAGTVRAGGEHAQRGLGLFLASPGRARRRSG